MVWVSKADSAALVSYTCLVLCSLINSATSYTALSDASLHKLPSPGETLDPYNGKLLQPLMIPRVVNTEGSRKALQHFTDFFTGLNWKLNFDNFSEPTAISSTPVPFVNFWATLDPPWKKEERMSGEIGRMVLAAHYDSLIQPAGFIGATDSAAPCAMLMHVAKAMDGPLRRRWEKMQEENDELEMQDEQGLMVLLLDGEEAFKHWTATDSIYGARHLAELWETTPHLARSTFKNHLSSISVFVLLDLLGAKFPKVPSYFRNTHWLYQHLASIELRLRSLDLLQTGKNTPPFLPDAEKTVFPQGFMVQDDHLPFMMRGVDVLHLIPTPFPKQWHTMEDNAAGLDKRTVNDWAVILEGFVAGYYRVGEFFSEDGDGLSTVSRMKRANKTEL